MNEQLEKKLEKLIDAMRENQPQLGADKFNTGDSDDIPTGTELTLTWNVYSQWITHLVKAYSDKRTGCTYKWIINGKLYEYNEVEFYCGKVVSGETVQTIVLIIANTSGSTVSVDYSVMGWGDRREGL